MERLVGGALDEETLKCIEGKDDASLIRVVGAVRGLRLLRRRFLVKGRLRRSTRRAIEDDVLERMGSQLSGLSAGARAQAIAKCWRSLPPRFFFSGRCAALFLRVPLKRSLKRLLGRKEERTQMKAREGGGVRSGSDALHEPSTRPRGGCQARFTVPTAPDRTREHDVPGSRPN
jgi:hypothetical protein